MLKNPLKNKSNYGKSTCSRFYIIVKIKKGDTKPQPEQSCCAQSHTGVFVGFVLRECVPHVPRIPGPESEISPDPVTFSLPSRCKPLIKLSIIYSFAARLSRVKHRCCREKIQRVCVKALRFFLSAGLHLMSSGDKMWEILMGWEQNYDFLKWYSERIAIKIGNFCHPFIKAF